MNHFWGDYRKIVINIPQGKKADAKDINALQQNFSEAIAALIKFYDGTNNETETVAYVNSVMSDLAAHRENVLLDATPELGLFGDM